MGQHELLKDLLILFGFATLIAVLLQRARQSSIVAYLLTGMLVGPSGLQLISNREAIELMAEIGVVLLLFSIGIELSLEKLLRMRKLVLGAGTRQVVLTVMVSIFAALAIGYPWRQSVIWGFLIAASSTAIVLKLLIERQELESLHGRAILSVLLFQDVCVVPMMAVLPSFAEPPGRMVLSGLRSLGEALLIGGAILVTARYFYPALWRYIVRLRNKEIFLIAAIFFSVGTAWVSSVAGLSLAMGAFLAGLALSQSDYAHQILSDILPLRDAFTSLFFISVGMLLDLGFARDNWAIVAAFAAGILTLKMLTAMLSVLTIGFPTRLAILVGLGLAHVGEFSFILLHQSAELGLITDSDYQAFLAAAIVTMILTPVAIQASPLLATRLSRSRRLRRFFAEPAEAELESEAAPLQDHVIICGYGLNGRLAAQVLRQVGIPYVVVETDPEIVTRAAAQGEHIFFGDSTRREIIEKAGAGRARAIVYAISDPFVLARAVSNARLINPRLSIIVRTARLEDAKGLEHAGASKIVAAETKAAEEIIVRVLAVFGRKRSEAVQQFQQAFSASELQVDE